MSKQESIKIGLVKIQDKKYYQDLDFECDGNIGENQKLPFVMSISNKFSFNLEKQYFEVDLQIEYLDEENENKVILEAENRFTFMIENLKDYLQVDPADKKSFSLQVDFVPTLLGVAIGTMRGFIHAKTAMTPLINYPMPMVALDELVEQSKKND